MQFPITIGLHRSRILDAMLCLTAILAIASTLSFRSSLLVCVGLLTVILILATVAWRALTPAIKAIRLERNGDIFMLRAGEHDFVQAFPGPGATVHPWLTVIRLNVAEGRSATLIAAADSQSPSDFRRLRMFMRWQANFSALGDAA